MHKIAILSMVRNEADVIESFVRHHAAVADVFYIIDHASTDATAEILEHLRAEGLPLVLSRYDGVAQVQAELLTGQMAQAFADGADIVLPLDADEFLWPEAGRSLADCRKALQSFPLQAVGSWSWVPCELLHPEEGQDVLLSRRPARRCLQPESIGKVIVGREAFASAREKNGRLAQGNHHFIIDGERGPQRIIPQELSGMFLAHFSWRSEEQAASKVAVGWLANVAKYSRQTTKANHWRKDFQRLLRNEPLRPHAHPGAMVALPPITGAGKAERLRYTPAHPGGVMQRVLAAAEELAESCCEMRVLLQPKRVSIVLPYLGAPEPFAHSLASILKEGYPYGEILVLPLADDAFARQLPSFLGGQETDQVIILLEGEDAAARFRDLQQTASGDYVQWLLPGDSLVPGKLLRMVCALEGDSVLAFVTSNGKGDAGEGTFVLPVVEAFQQGAGTDVAAVLRMSGQRLSGGLAAPLFRRSDMERWQWLAACFPAGAPDLRKVWQMVFPGSVFGVMQEPQVVAAGNPS